MEEPSDSEDEEIVETEEELRKLQKHAKIPIK